MTAAAIACAALVMRRNMPPHRIVMATGPEGDAYYEVSKRYPRRSRRPTSMRFDPILCQAGFLLEFTRVDAQGGKANSKTSGNLRYRLGRAQREDAAMLIVRLATAPDPNPMPGILRVELEGLGIPVSLPMPPPGLTTTPQPLPPPSMPGSFTMKIYYYLDELRVGVIVKGVGADDSINIFASRLDTPVVPAPGVLYVGNIIHGDLTTEGHDCSVQCEHGIPVVEECCVVCRNENIVTETCC
jgi:hypothetical protein